MVSVRTNVTRLLAGVVLAASSPALAQQPRAVPAEGARGSFAVTFGGAIVGALVGAGVGALAAPSEGFMCPTQPGARCGDGSGAVLAVIGGTVAGAASGAILGRHLSGGRQSAVRSLLGAALGLLASGALLSQLHTDAAVPVVVGVTVPPAFFAALVGW